MSSTANSPKKKGEHRALRFIVISMGLLLVGGTIFLFAAVIHKASQEEGVTTPAQTSAQTSAPEQKLTGTCGMVPLDFRGRGRIIALEIEASSVHAVTQPEGAPTAIITINRCTGEVVSQQTIVGDSAAPATAPQVETPAKKAE